VFLGDSSEVEHDVYHERAEHERKNAQNTQEKCLGDVFFEHIEPKNRNRYKNENPVNKRDDGNYANDVAQFDQ
jgi:hypothetical protein